MSGVQFLGEREVGLGCMILGAFKKWNLGKISLDEYVQKNARHTFS